MQRFKLQLLTTSCRETVVYGRLNPTLCDRGAIFVPPPHPLGLHETGTIRKHWNRATIYAETKCVLGQLSEIRVLECRLKIAKLQKRKDPLRHVVISQQRQR